MPKQKAMVYGFWRYDLFPYCVGGELTEPYEGKWNGKYGWWHWGNNGIVRPFVTMSIKEGREIKAKLEDLTQEHRTREKELKEEMFKKAQELLDIPK